MTTFRATSRVLLTDPAGRALMFLQYGKDHAVPPRWITPGGGVDPGEDHAVAAIRELYEETGIRIDAVPAPFRDEDFAPDQRWHPYETGHWAWYVVPVDEEFEPSREGWTDEELIDVVEHRWFTADELALEHRLGYEVEPPELPKWLRAHTLPVVTAADAEAAPVVDANAFTNEDGVALGLHAVDVIRERGLDLAVRVVLRGDTVFQAKLGATGPGNDEWLAGKAAATAMFDLPSLAVRRRHEEAGTPFRDRTDIDHGAIRAYGGALPIRVRGEQVGTITLSGEPDVIDHSAAAEAVRRYREDTIDPQDAS